MHIRSIKNDQSGALLLVSLLLLGVIAVSTLYLSLILVNEIKNTRFADNSIISYYSAESGAEDSLWRLKYARDNNETAFFSGEQSYARCAAESGDTSQNGCLTADSESDPERFFDYKVVTLQAAEFTASNLEINSPVIASIYDPSIEGMAAVMGADGITEFWTKWYLDSCVGIDGSARLEITYTPILIQTLEPGDPLNAIDVCNCTNSDAADGETDGLFRCNPTLDYSRKITGLDINSFYTVSYRSLDVEVAKLTMTTEESIVPSQIEVQSTGVYRETLSSMTMEASWKNALSGIFNYVVFSEDSIIKDVKGESSSPYGSLCGFCTTDDVRCSSDSDCVNNDCDVENDSSTDPDGSDSEPFCSDTTGGEVFPGPPIDQTDGGSCNLLCNGFTLCGDGTRQDTGVNNGPNGAGIGGNDGAGGYPGTGYEECDEGVSNSDIVKDTCRQDCRDPYCGDGVDDDLTGPGPSDIEECDDADTDDLPGDAVDDGGCVIHPAILECKSNVCGDGYLYGAGSGGTEVCDDGTANVTVCSPPGTDGACLDTCLSVC